MDQQTSSEIQLRPKSKLPIVALMLSLSSIIFCCVSIAIGSTPDFLVDNLPVFFSVQGILCVGAIMPFIGMVVGGISLTNQDANKAIAISAIFIGTFAIVTVVFAILLLFLMYFAIHAS